MTPITSWNEDENCYFDDEQGRITQNNRFRKTLCHIDFSSVTKDTARTKWFTGETAKNKIIIFGLNIFKIYLFLANIDFDTDRDHQRNLEIRKNT